MASLSNRVISIYKHKTSIRLAPAEWEAIDTICQIEKITRTKLFEIVEINRNKNLGFTTSVRLFSIIYYRNSFLSKQNTTPNTAEYSPVLEAARGII